MILNEIQNLHEPKYLITLELRKKGDGEFAFFYKEFYKSSGKLKRTKRFYLDGEKLKLLKKELENE